MPHFPISTINTVQLDTYGSKHHSSVLLSNFKWEYCELLLQGVFIQNHFPIKMTVILYPTFPLQINKKIPRKCYFSSSTMVMDYMFPQWCHYTYNSSLHFTLCNVILIISTSTSQFMSRVCLYIHVLFILRNITCFCSPLNQICVVHSAPSHLDPPSEGSDRSEAEHKYINKVF